MLIANENHLRDLIKKEAPETAIWDFDETIVASKEIHRRAFEIILNNQGVLPPQTFFDKYFGLTEREVWRGLQNEFSFTCNIEEVTMERIDLVNKLLQIVKPNWFVIPLLANLQTKSIKSYVVSAGDAKIISSYLEHWKLLNCFSEISAASLSGGSKKERMNMIISDKTIVLEDSPVYLEHANSRGALCIAVSKQAPAQKTSYWINPSGLKD